MKIDLRKTLLAGTAIVAVGAFAGAAQAQDHTLVGAATWASAGGADSSNIANAAAGDSVELDGNALTITDGGAAGDPDPDDGSAAGTFNLGAVTGTGGGSDVIVLQSAGALAATIESVEIDGNMSVDNDDTAADADVEVTLGGDSSIGGTLDITNNEGDAATVQMTAAGSLNVDGLTTITGGGNAGATSTLILLDGATFGGGVVLDDATGSAILMVGGTVTQTIAGDIDGDGAGEGILFISNSSAAGVIFEGKIGDTNDIDQIILSNEGAGSTVTFKDVVGVDNASGIVVGDGAGNADVYTVVFDGEDASGFTVDGTVQGAAVDSSRVSVIGGETIVQANAWGNVTALNLLTVTGTDTILDSNAAITVDNVTIGTGATLDVGAGLLTADVTVGGTLLLSGAGGVTGNVTGASGTLDVNANATVTGSVTGLDLIDMADGATLTVASTGAAAAITVEADSIVINDAAGDNAGLTLNGDGQDINVSSVVTTANGGEGRVQTAGDSDVNFAANIGESGTLMGLLDITATSTANVAGNVFAEDVNIAAGATLNLTGASKVVSGTVDGGTVIVATGASTTFEDIIGGGTGLVLFDINGTATVEAAVDTDSGDPDEAGLVVDGTLNIDVTGAAGDIAEATGDIDFNGTVNITGTGNAAGIVAASDLFIDGTFTTAIESAHATTLTGTNSLVIGGSADTTMNISNNVVLGSPATFGADGLTIMVIVNKTDNFDPEATAAIGAGGNLLTFTADSVTRFSAGSGFDGGETIILVNNAGATDFAAALTAGTVVLNDNGLVGLVDNGSGAGLLQADLRISSAADVFGNTPGATAADALLAIDAADVDGKLADARTALMSAATQAEAQAIAESLAPTVDGSHMAAAMTNVATTFSMVGDRLASLRQGDAVTGMATGNMASGVRVWTQGFGGTGEQDSRDGVDGYDFDTWGAAFGMDTANMAENATIGIALSYADTEADSDNASRTSTEIDSYQVTLYGDYDIDSRTYVNGLAAYTWSDIDTTRTVLGAGGAALGIADGDFDAGQFTLRAEVGRDYAYEGMTLTPNLMAHWSNYDADSYDETGTAGNAALRNVDSDTLNVFELGVGVDASWMFRNSDGSHFSPEIGIGYRYDLVGDEIDTTASFIGGGQAFTTEGFDAQRSTVDLGVGFTYYSTQNWEFTAEYDYEWKADFDGHSGLVRAAYRF